MADVLIAFEPAEACRNLPFLKKGGYVIVSDTAVKPVTDALSDADYNGAEMLSYLETQDVRLTVVPCGKITLSCGSVRVLNMVLLGAAAASGALGLTAAELCAIMREMLPQKLVEMNEKALFLGADYVKNGI